LTALRSSENDQHLASRQDADFCEESGESFMAEMQSPLLASCGLHDKPLPSDLKGLYLPLPFRSPHGDVRDLQHKPLEARPFPPLARFVSSTMVVRQTVVVGSHARRRALKKSR